MSSELPIFVPEGHQRSESRSPRTESSEAPKDRADYSVFETKDGVDLREVGMMVIDGRDAKGEEIRMDTVQYLRDLVPTLDKTERYSLLRILLSKIILERSPDTHNATVGTGTLLLPDIREIFDQEAFANVINSMKDDVQYIKWLPVFMESADTKGAMQSFLGGQGFKGADGSERKVATLVAVSAPHYKWDLTPTPINPEKDENN